MIAKSFPHISARHLREAIDRLPELQGINLRFEQMELLFSVAERTRGFPRHIALHPCGIVLASHDLVERVPLERSANGHRMIQADKDDVELLGYLKLDILGVRMLSSMRHALDEIARTTGEKVDLDRIAARRRAHLRADPRAPTPWAASRSSRPASASCCRSSSPPAGRT